MTIMLSPTPGKVHARRRDEPVPILDAAGQPPILDRAARERGGKLLRSRDEKVKDELISFRAPWPSSYR